MDLKAYKETVYQVIGSAMTVRLELGGGLLEAIYNEALVMELTGRGIQAEAEKEIPCYYKGERMKKFYKMDILVENDIIVELKSIQEITPAHRAQLFNYLRLTQKPIGILINFGRDGLEGERYAYFAENNECVMINKAMEPIHEVWEYDE